METHELHRGRLIDHVQLVVRDLAASQAFYQAVFDVLEVPMGGTGDGYFWADELFVSTADNDAAQGELTGRCHLAFQARNRAMVDAFHQAGSSAGFRSLGEPVVRPQDHPGYYARYLQDPDCHNLEAVYHGEAD